MNVNVNDLYKLYLFFSLASALFGFRWISKEIPLNKVLIKHVKFSDFVKLCGYVFSLMKQEVENFGLRCLVCLWLNEYGQLD